MKLSKAKELLRLELNDPGSVLYEDLSEAQQLGIEAIKEVIKARYGDPALDGELLHGETEE